MIVEVLRWVVVVCSATTIVVGTPQWRAWWRDYPPVIVQGRMALAALNVAAGYGTAESMWRGIPGGPRTFVVAVGAVWTLYTVAWQPTLTLINRLPRSTRARHRPAD